jgi:hypothetical protein
MAAEAGLLYRHTGTVLIRATTAPGELALPDELDLFGDRDAEAESAHAWLAKAWRPDEIREAIHLTSPVLSRQVEEVLAGRRADTRRVRRIMMSLASYLLRWQGRPSPFGLFAGLAVVTVGSQPVVRWGTDHRVVVRSGRAVAGCARRPFGAVLRAVGAAGGGGERHRVRARRSARGARPSERRPTGTVRPAGGLRAPYPAGARGAGGHLCSHSVR